MENISLHALITAGKIHRKQKADINVHIIHITFSTSSITKIDPMDLRARYKKHKLKSHSAAYTNKLLKYVELCIINMRFAHLASPARVQQRGTPLCPPHAVKCPLLIHTFRRSSMGEKTPAIEIDRGGRFMLAGSCKWWDALRRRDSIAAVRRSKSGFEIARDTKYILLSALSSSSADMKAGLGQHQALR